MESGVWVSLSSGWQPVVTVLNIKRRLVAKKFQAFINTGYERKKAKKERLVNGTSFETKQKFPENIYTEYTQNEKGLNQLLVLNLTLLVNLNSGKSQNATLVNL